jgi:phosphatidylinositol alpha-1,6-mannosyltransferase
MRRALVTNEFAPTHGGVERLLYERARGYHPEDLTVFATFTPDCEAFDELQAYRSRRSGRLLSTIPLLRDLIRSLTPLIDCFREHRRREFDVIECGQAFPACLFARAMHRKYGTQYLVWVHGNDLLGPSRYRLLRSAIRKSLLQAHAVITNSSYTAGVVAELGIPDENIKVIMPVVDTEKFRPAAPAADLLTRYGIVNQQVMLTVGRLVERKGVDLSLEAVERLISAGKDIKYLIVGDGPRKHDLQQLAAKLGLDDHVVFAGSVAEEELAAHYNLANLFVMPSRYMPDEGSVEGLGLVYLEAMASALPVIAGRSGGVPDIVLPGENGLLVDPGSVTELTQAIDRLLSDDAYAKKLGQNGLAFVQRPRDWEVLDV